MEPWDTAVGHSRGTQDVLDFVRRRLHLPVAVDHRLLQVPPFFLVVVSVENDSCRRFQL